MKHVACHIAILLLIGAVAALGGFTACHQLEPEIQVNEALTISTFVEGVSVSTKASADDALKENSIETLDVFIEGKDDAFWKHYHISPNTADKASSEVQHLLAPNWKEVTSDLDTSLKLDANKHYKVYVVANTTLDLMGVTASSALAALVESDVTASYSTTTNLSVYKIYDASAPAGDRTKTASKKFLMDGVADDWSPVPEQQQVIEVNLARAASKFEVDITFSDEFKAWLAQEDLPNNKKKMTIDGNPGWRFYGFAFDTPVFNPQSFNPSADEVKPASVTKTSEPLLFGDYTPAGTGGEYDKTFMLTTYSYSTCWTEEDAINNAPALIVSCAYLTEGESQPAYNYYRIPLVNQETTFEIGRNKLYKIHAVIDSQGSSSSIDSEPVRVSYEVVEWNSEQHSGDNKSPVEPKVNYYFQVTPLEYTLRGEGEQQVQLIYYAPVGFNPQSKSIPSGELTRNTDVSYSSFFFDKNGSAVQVSDGYTLEYDYTHHKITVKSTVLANRAVKYFRFRLYITAEGQEYYQDVYIKHFPTDNIQQINGWWSSRIDGAQATISMKDVTQTIETYEYRSDYRNGWTEEESIEFAYDANPGNSWTREQFTSVDIGETYTSYSGQTYKRGPSYVSWGRTYYYYYYWHRYYRVTTQTVTTDINTTHSWVRWGENSDEYRIASYDIMQAKVYENGKIYFIQDSDCYLPNEDARSISMVEKLYRLYGYTGNYRQDGYWYFHRYQRNNNRWTNFVSPYATYNSASDYSLNTAGWDKYDAYFTYTGYDRSNTYEEPNEIGGFVRKPIRGEEYQLTNNQMYVVQITKTSEDYIVGRPTVDPTTHQSQDHVVSPAFMIASQLGALSRGTTLDPTVAAAHCAEYMEVATDGTRYSGWRLPTAEEISVIIKYQADPVTSQTIATVLSDCNYYALDGTGIWTGLWDDTDDNRARPPFIRCVRDLSPEEVNALNNK